MRGQHLRSIKRAFVCLAAALAALGIALVVPTFVYACTSNEQSCSTGYGVDQVFFGSGGSLDTTCGTSYCAKEAVGETAVGNTIGGSTYQAQAGFNTDRVPSLTFCVYKTTCGDDPSLNVGTLVAGTTTTGTVKFAVKTYLASSYVVVINGAAPTNGGYTMHALTSPTASNTTQEQFGVNVVANTSCGGGMPGSLGADPVQVPSSSFSFGAAATGYNTACQFKYVSGDTVASSTKSSGETDFTMSYIFNITNTTRGGTYTTAQSLVATSTF